MKEIPREVIERLKFFCEENDLGMAQISDGAHFKMLIMGPRKFAPDQISVIAAHALLETVITGAAHIDNETKKEIEKEIKSKPVN